MRSTLGLPAVPVFRNNTKHRAQSVRAMAMWVLQFVALAAAAGGVWAQPALPSLVEGEFDKIEIHGVTLLVDWGAASRKVVTDGKASPPRMSVKSGTLRVVCVAPCDGRSSATVRVTTPRLSAIRIDNGGKVQVGEGFPTAPAFGISISGGGVVQAASLRADTVAVVIENGGEASVSAIRSLSSKIRGGGTLQYFGDPQLLADTQGGGSVTRVGAIPARPAASTLKDPRDGHLYETVTIGTQLWMRQNLAFLPRICRPDDADCGFWVYGYSDRDTVAARKTPEYQQSGVLYSWVEALRACPEGWHLPTDEEWQQLETTLGMSAADAASSVWRGADEGNAMKMGGSSGLDVVLAGWRTSFGSFNFLGEHANFWTATEADAQHAIERLIGASKNQIGRHTGMKGCGFSVRCVRD
ncbi:MAG: DUF2807 domain-containing protein [Bryobacterales bacterium]|nr:DUF2807 domain-containing protein [Bryobacterales bacterium]